MAKRMSRDEKVAAMNRHIEQSQQRYEEIKKDPRHIAYVNTLGLGAWLERAEKAGVSAIGARQSPAFPLSELFDAMDGKSAPGLNTAMEWLKSEMSGLQNWPNNRVIVRWEDCSDENVKYLAAKGDFKLLSGLFGPNVSGVRVDDCRLLDCSETDPQHLYIRPWVPAVMISGYPVEFRFYFGMDGYQGASSYYPQRPLSPDMVIHRPNSSDSEVQDRPLSEWVEQMKSMAERVYQSDTFPIGCTMDFLLPEMGEPLFLEGGPPHLQRGGAHPCCHAPGQISGIAYEAQPGSEGWDRRTDDEEEAASRAMLVPKGES